MYVEILFPLSGSVKVSCAQFQLLPSSYFFCNFVRSFTQICLEISKFVVWFIIMWRYSENLARMQEFLLCICIRKVVC